MDEKPPSKRPTFSLPEKGDVFAGRYRILGERGSGAMGSVFLAQDTMLQDNILAVKILNPELAKDESQTSRFLREVELTRQITHLNVVRTFDIGTFDGFFFFTMELVEGSTLQSLVEHKPLSVEQFKLYFSQICYGLVAIHENQIIHRDLKSSNILLTPSGTIKITDFGVARPDISHLTAQHEIVGSATHIAPEVWRHSSVGYGTDIYALGVVAYEMLTGELPFDAATPYELMWKHLKESPKAPSLLAPSVPPELDQLVLKMMEKESSARPKNCHEILTFLGMAPAAAGQNLQSQNNENQPFHNQYAQSENPLSLEHEESDSEYGFSNYKPAEDAPTTEVVDEDDSFSRPPPFLDTTSGWDEEKRTEPEQPQNQNWIGTLVSPSEKTTEKAYVPISKLLPYEPPQELRTALLLLASCFLLPLFIVTIHYTNPLSWPFKSIQDANLRTILTFSLSTLTLALAGSVLSMPFLGMLGHRRPVRRTLLCIFPLVLMMLVSIATWHATRIGAYWQGSSEKDHKNGERALHSAMMINGLEVLTITAKPHDFPAKTTGLAKGTLPFIPTEASSFEASGYHAFLVVYVFLLGLALNGKVREEFVGWRAIQLFVLLPVWATTSAAINVLLSASPPLRAKLFDLQLGLFSTPMSAALIMQPICMWITFWLFSAILRRLMTDTTAPTSAFVKTKVK